MQAERNRLARTGRLVQAEALHTEIKEAERQVKEAEEYEESLKPRPISEIISKDELNEMGIIPLMIECHLAADFLTETAFRVVETCKRHGLSDISLMPDLNEIIKKTEMFASFLTKVSPELSDLIVRNEKLNASLHKRYVGYIEKKIK